MRTVGENLLECVDCHLYMKMLLLYCIYTDTVMCRYKKKEMRMYVQLCIIHELHVLNSKYWIIILKINQ